MDNLYSKDFKVIVRTMDFIISRFSTFSDAQREATIKGLLHVAGINQLNHKGKIDVDPQFADEAIRALVCIKNHFRPDELSNLKEELQKLEQAYQDQESEELKLKDHLAEFLT